MSRRSIRAGSSLFILANACSAAPAFSQLPQSEKHADATSQAAARETDANSTMVGTEADIVVTAQRREQRLQEVPAAVSALSAATLTRQQIVQIADVARSVPGFQVSQPFGDGGPPNFIIRGITAVDYSLNQSKPIAIYLDEGVRNMQAFDFVPLFDVDRLEVLRGPQGTLYGKNATGGAVNIITKRPGLGTEGYVSAGYGNFDRRSLQGAVQAPIVDGILAARVAFTHVKDEGTIQVVTPGLKNMNQTDVFGLRVGLYFKPSDSFDATLRFSHNRAGGRNYLPLPTDIDLSAWPNLAAVPGADRAGLKFFESAPDATPKRRINNDGVNLQMQYHISDEYNVTSITTYDWGRWRNEEDFDGLPIQLVVSLNDAKDIWQFVQEFRLTSSLDGPLNWDAGIFYSRDRVKVDTRYDLFLDPRCGIDCNFGIGSGSGLVQASTFLQRRTSYAGYLRAKFEITPSLATSVGVRRSSDRLRVPQYSASLGDSVDPFLIPTIVSERRRSNFKNTSFEAGVDWKPVRDVLIYGSFKQGYRTGAVNGQAFALAEEITVAPPEKVDSYEVGAKVSFLDSAVIINSAMFQMNYRNQQVLANINGTFPLRSIPRARIRGLELEASVRPVRAITLNGSMSLLDPKYRSGAFTPPTSTDGSVVDIAGNQMTNSSKVLATVSGTATVAEWNLRRLNVIVSGNYTSKIYNDIFETEAISQDGYWLANARIAYEDPRFSIGFGIKNIFNEQYAIAKLYTQYYGFNDYVRGAPRQYGGDITFRF